MKKAAIKATHLKLPLPVKNVLQLKNEKRKPYIPSDKAPKFDLTGSAIERHRCNECGDVFLFKSSLEDHVNRKSLTITFNCSLCKKVITLYNRCSFLSHSTFHLNQNEVSDISISPLNSLIISGNDSSITLPKVTEQLNNEASDEKEINKCVPSTSAAVKLKYCRKELKNSVEKNGKDRVKSVVSIPALKCFECGSILNNTKQVQDHYGATTGVPVECDLCTLCCPNTCSLQAHKRLHCASKPHVCPECGEEFSEVHSLTVHTIMRCQHLFRHIVYSCPFCCSTIKTSSLLVEHIANCHTQVSLQCSVCLFKFDSESSFDTHNKVVHTNEDAKLTKLFKCEHCMSEISSLTFFYTHIENHVKSLQTVTRFHFSCPQCDERLCASKSQLLVHLKAAHLLDLKNSFKTKENLVNMMTKNLCQRFNIRFDTKEAIEGEAQIEKQNVTMNENSFVCETCSKMTKTREEMFSHGKSDHMSRGVYVCLICMNKGMGSEESLLKHLNITHSNETKCPLNACNNLKFGAYTVLDHFIEKHGLINRLDAKDDDICSDRIDEPALKKVKISNSKQYNNGFNNPKNGKNGFSRSFSCSVCDYSFMEEGQFKLHMNVHKNDKAPFLCYECGSCFVSAPSFKRHLQSEHKIENGNDYIAKYLPELFEAVSEDTIDVISLIQDESLTESICPVCKATYANSTDLKTHVRVHGMAFIKSCQKNNSVHFVSL